MNFNLFKIDLFHNSVRYETVQKALRQGRQGGLLMILPVLVLACSSPPVLKAIQVTSTVVESIVTTTSSGTVVAEQQAVLAFGAVGRVNKVWIKIGDQVTRGKILAELESADLKIVAQDALLELKRAQELFQAGLISQAALDAARRAYEIAKANLDKSMIIAPFHGIVTEVHLEVGELVQTATSPHYPPIRLIDLKPRLVKGDIDELDLAKVKVNAPARIKIPAIQTEAFPALVQKVVPFVSTVKEQDRTSEVELKIINARPELIPVGASADIEIITQSKNHVLAVPSQVVLGQGDKKYVYHYRNGKIYKQFIKVGIWNYERTEVLSNLQEKDLVIFPPDDLELKDGSRVKIEQVQWPLLK